MSALLRSGDAAVLAPVSTGGRTAGLSYFCPTDPTCRLAPAPCPSAGAGARCCSALASAASKVKDRAAAMSALEVAQFSSHLGGTGLSNCPSCVS